MTLAAGTRIGPYEIRDAIGAGGMGEVYRARDTRLDRDVAVKVLPESVAHDPDRLARFEREARTLAALNHPNIATIHGLEEGAGVRGLVMELVEGPTLADRIARGAVPFDEAVSIATQIAEALESAHEQSIVHRDLKPANIKLRPDGTVKVLDFGLAKALDPSSESGPGSTSAMGLSQSPTITSPALLTGAGVILGTAAYMSPEQAKGRPADRRSDVWAFGCLLYEMLAGSRPFDGEDMTEVLGAVVRLEPDWRKLPAHVPPAVRALVQGCLVKDRRRRISDVSAVLFVLRHQKDFVASEAPAGTATGLLRGSRLAWGVAVVLLALALGLAAPAMRHLREASAAAPAETRTEIATSATPDLLSFALSPDGTHVVFVASGDGTSRLWLRPLAATEARPLGGTEQASYPFWSPDSRSIAFFADGQLRRLDLADGAIRTLAVTAARRGGAWNQDGVILFEQSITGPIVRIEPSNVEPVAVTAVDRQTGHRYPQFLPDGRRFLYFALGSAETGGIFLASLDSAEAVRLTPSETAGLYLPSGLLLWSREGSLVAQRLDLERGALAGEIVNVASEISFDTVSGALGASTSPTGLIAYRTGAVGQRQLTWFDRSGKPLATFGGVDGTQLGGTLSPDGRRAAVTRTVRGNIDIWLLDGIRETRFTSDAAAERFPVWSPDGRQLVFTSNRAGQANLFIKAVDGSDTEQPVVPAAQNQYPMNWSADGQALLYLVDDSKAGFDIWAVLVRGNRTPWKVVATAFDERGTGFSPDGRWLTYVSNESGRYEVYARRWATPESTATGAGGQWQISTNGGTYGRWSPNGRELYYIGPESELIAVPIAADGDTLKPGAPSVLFRTRIVGGGDVNQGMQYTVTRDGRFLINTLVDDVSTAPITLIQNWRPPAP
jgi:Tol biopolymer transport system component